MKAIGFSMHVAMPVLKYLIKVYHNNWEYIEVENYRVLADAILDAQESKDLSGGNNDVLASDESEPHRMTLRQEVTEDISPQPSRTSERCGPISPQINSRETSVHSCS
uniref:Uncharacterized protein LOC114912789 n=1 Tax=Elaeis guineensis var. tenera TaxID=51953 RepID=A0A8N4EPW8_ELAGV|nr:uncharacterized protein LOC114912789 [Elaeis guineensis]